MADKHEIIQTRIENAADFIELGITHMDTAIAKLEDDTYLPRPEHYIQALRGVQDKVKHFYKNVWPGILLVKDVPEYTFLIPNVLRDLKVATQDLREVEQDMRTELLKQSEKRLLAKLTEDTGKLPHELGDDVYALFVEGYESHYAELLSAIDEFGSEHHFTQQGNLPTLKELAEMESSALECLDSISALNWQK